MMDMEKIDREVVSQLIGENVRSLKISSGSAKGDNVAGCLKSVQATTDSGKVHHIVIKLTPESPAILSYIVNGRIMELENYFYSQILKKIRNFIKNKFNKGQERNNNTYDDSDSALQLPFPKYFGYFDSSCSNMFLALEDLRPSGYRMGNKFTGLTFAETSVALKAIAKFHALTFSIIRDQGEKIFYENDLTLQLVQFPWYSRNMDPKYYPQVSSMFTSVIEIVKKAKPAIGKKLENMVPRFNELFPGIYNKTDVEYFPVICHGDLWVNNILFKYQNQNQQEKEEGQVSKAKVELPVEVKFIDLQQAHRGNIFEDLMYFFITSTTTEFRKNNLIPSLRIYYESFVKTIEELKGQMPLKFSLGFLIDEYFKNLVNISVFVGGAIAFQLGNIDPEVESAGSRPHEKENLNLLKGTAVENLDSDTIVLKRYSPEELMPLGEHYQGMGEFCSMCLHGDQRAIDRFLDIMQEFDHLRVFDTQV